MFILMLNALITPKRQNKQVASKFYPFLCFVIKPGFLTFSDVVRTYSYHSYLKRVVILIEIYWNMTILKHLPNTFSVKYQHTFYHLLVIFVISPSDRTLSTHNNIFAYNADIICFGLQLLIIEACVLNESSCWIPRIRPSSVLRYTMFTVVL